MLKNSLSALNKEDAITLALKERDLQDTLKTLSVRDIEYRACSDYDSILNIRVANYSKKKKKVKAH